MLNKIYLALLGTAILVMSFFTIYSYSWLSSIGDPAIAAENFSYFSQVGWNFLWISFICLIIFANVLIWKNGRSWSVWSSFVYFTVFMVTQTLWLAPSLLAFKKSNNLIENSFSFTPFIGVMTIVVLGIAVFCGQFIVIRLRDRILGRSDTEEREA